MTWLGWQALLLLPLLAAIVGLARLLRGRPHDRARTPILRFLLTSVLAHLGLLFVLDLVLVTVPVVEANREFLEAVVLRTFSVGPVSRAPRASWEKLPDGPPVSAPVESAAPAPAAGLAFAPELKAMTPTVPESVARSLPPSRLLFLPRREPPTAGSTALDLPRSIALAPDLPTLEVPPLAAPTARPEREPRAPAVVVEHRAIELPSAPVPPSETPPPRLADPAPAVLPVLTPIRRTRDLAGLDPPAAPGPARPTRIAPADDLDAPDLRRAGPLPTPKMARTAVPAPKDLAAPRAAAREWPPDRPAPAPPRDTIVLARVELPKMTREPKAEVRRPDLPAPPRRVRPEPEPEAAEPEIQYAMRRPEARREFVPALGGNAASEAAVERGLAWLAGHQGPDGNWSLHDLHCKGHACQEAGAAQSDAAATGLALMAFLGAGHAPNKGSHAEPVRRGVAWLIAHQRPDGDLAGPGGAQMYGHGLATIALCEALGVGGDPALRGPAERALRFIIEAQDPGNGGWRYSPRGGGDTSVFGWQVMALKSGEMAGLPIPAATYERARRWLDSVGAGPGRLLYEYQAGRGPSPAMTAEALLCRQYLGLPRQAETMVAGGSYLKAHLPDWKERNSYSWYYATQVMFHLQGEGWAAWNPKIRDMLVDAQVKDGPAAGSWSPHKPSGDRWGGEGGRLYETSISLLMLEVYYRHLPLYLQLSDGPPKR